MFTGPDGVDELGVSGAAAAFEVTPDGVRRQTVDPRDVGFEPAAPAQLRGGDATDNARTVLAVLDGEHGAARNVVVLNAAAALVVVGADPKIAQAVPRAAEAIDSGAARARLAALVDVSNHTWA